MLKINTTINLNGTSEINGQVVAYMSASISTDGQSANINKSIANQDLYNANKASIRAVLQSLKMKYIRLRIQ